MITLGNILVRFSISFVISKKEEEETNKKKTNGIVASKRTEGIELSVLVCTVVDQRQWEQNNLYV